LQTQFWQNQALDQVLRFGGENTFLGIKVFVLIVCLKHNKIWRAQKRFGGNCPRITPVSAGMARTIARKSSFGNFMSVQGSYTF